MDKQTPQERWQKKAGLVSKSYKLQSEVVEKFAEACKKSDISQARQLTELMKDFINKVSNDNK